MNLNKDYEFKVDGSLILPCSTRPDIISGECVITKVEKNVIRAKVEWNTFSNRIYSDVGIFWSDSIGWYWDAKQ